MAPTSCFSGQVHRLPDAPQAYGAMITRPKAAPAQTRSADLTPTRRPASAVPASPGYHPSIRACFCKTRDAGAHRLRKCFLTLAARSTWGRGPVSRTSKWLIIISVAVGVLAVCVGAAYLFLPGEASDRIAIGTAVGSVVGGLIGAWAPSVVDQSSRTDDPSDDARNADTGGSTQQSVGGSGFNFSAGNGGVNFQGATFTFGPPGSSSSQNMEPNNETGAMPPKVIRLGEIPREPPGYQQRTNLLQNLRQVAIKNSPTAVHALTGLRGVGKTHLAAAYARECINDEWPVVAWLNGENPEQLVSSLASLAELLGVRSPNQDSTAAARAARNFLETTTERALVVIDNAENPEKILAWIPATGGTHVVITTSHHAFYNAAQTIDVSVYTPEQAKDYLVSRTNLDDPNGAAQVAEELGYLPLALAQAAWLITIRGYTYREYLNQVRSAPIFHTLSAARGDSYPLSTAQTILLSVEQAESSESIEAIHSVLQVLSFLSSAGVQRPLLRKLLDDITPVDLDRALGSLAEASLITYSVDHGSVMMHRLVQRVLRDREEEKETIDETIARLVSRLRGCTFPGGNAWQRRGSGLHLCEQVIALTAHSARQDGEIRSWEVDLLHVRSWVHKFLADVLENARSISIAAALAIDSERILGRDDPFTLSALHNTAHALSAAGQLDEALELHRMVLSEHERVYGTDDLRTLTNRNCLANIYNRVGRTTEALAIHESVLVDRERILGPDHPSALTSRHNLAHAYESSGHHAKAIDLHRAVLSDRQRLFGPSDPRTLEARHCLASAYEASKRLDEAIALYKEVSADRERVLGVDDPKTLQTRQELASAYEASGRLEEAIEIHQALVRQRERLLGSEHSGTLVLRHSLARAYTAAGRHSEAVSVLESILAAAERSTGPDHRSAIDFRHSLAHAYQEAGRIHDSLPLHQAVLADREKYLGGDHPQTLTARQCLARAYSKATRKEDALPLYEAVLEGRMRVLGPDDQHTLAARHGLAHAYEDAGRIDESLRFHQEVLDDRNRVFGPDHPATLESRTCLARAYRAANRFDDAITLHQAVAADRERILGPNHPDTLSSRYSLAITYRAADRLDDAITLHQAVAADRERNLSPNHPDTLRSRYSLAITYRAADRLDDAITLHQAVAADRERILGPNHPDTLSSRRSVEEAQRAAQRQGRRRSLPWLGHRQKPLR
ncbi:Tetratricopeptide repeat-containing protein [Streptomyces melanosporofaciens]|uniref:Tetratricopeptide repeat-containing protein n=2 Tax=Streptomyces melanosporofaciens TaxID=67327 RepID=A0A1H4RKQ2_STRMJ|nr:Tetratricopeptide repeat-containing protein [Streptomyces melanosporofaciens]